MTVRNAVRCMWSTFDPGYCEQCGRKLRDRWSQTDACPGRYFCDSACISKYLARDAKWEPVR